MGNINEYMSRQEPAVLYCEREYNLLPGQRYGPITRKVYIIECCVEGYGSVIINGHEFSVSPGDCYILLPDVTVIHTADTAEPRKGYWCAVDGLNLGSIFKEAGISAQNPFAPAELFDELCFCLKKMVDDWRCDDVGKAFRETAYIYEFLGALMRGSKTTVHDDRIERALGLMEARFHEHLNVDEIAREVGLERSYFSVVFKEKTTVSPHKYLTSLRIRKACDLLEKEHCSISDAATATGLDPCNFARIFKRETGKTPIEYIHNRK